MHRSARCIGDPDVAPEVHPFVGSCRHSWVGAFVQVYLFIYVHFLAFYVLFMMLSSFVLVSCILCDVFVCICVELYIYCSMNVLGCLCMRLLSWIHLFA